MAAPSILLGSNLVVFNCSPLCHETVLGVSTMAYILLLKTINKLPLTCLTSYTLLLEFLSSLVS